MCVRHRQLVATRWKEPRTGWATELLPKRPGAFASSLLGPHARPYAAHERQEMVWNAPMPPLAARPEPSFNVINHLAYNREVDLSPLGESPRSKFAGGRGH